MRSATNTFQRRGTVLLMVVSLLAMLFVIVSGFLAIARFDEQTAREIEQGNDKDVIVDHVIDTLGGKIASSLQDTGSGSAMGGPGAAWATIPGEGLKTYWLASLNPVWRQGFLPAFPNGPPRIIDGGWDFPGGDWALRSQQMERFVYPAVTALEPLAGRSPTRALLHLIPELAFDFDPFFTDDDVIEAARSAWMDADGDGIPDSDITLAGLLSELGNALSGSPVRAPRATIPLLTDGGAFQRFRLHSIVDPANDFSAEPRNAARIAQEEIFRRYMDNRSVDVAARVVAHGGMVALTGAEVYDGFFGSYQDPVQRGFVMDLFDAIRSPLDVNSLGGLPVARQDDFFNEIAANRPAIENALRNRGWLPGRIGDDGGSGTPAILSIMQGDYTRRPGTNLSGWQQNIVFAETFMPAMADILPGGLVNSVRARPGDNDFEVRQRLAERVNIADVADDGDMVAALYSLTGGAGPNLTDRRHQITTVSNSDELARKQRTLEPDLSPTASPAARLRLHRGEQKFYLGQISAAFRSYGGAFGTATAEYYYAKDDLDAIDDDPGDFVVAELARYYREMIDSFGSAGDWANVLVPGVSANQQAVSKLQQAYMLAVNTVAFAAPRSADGWIPTVRYTPPGAPNTYVGFGPQPVLTEVILARENMDDSGPDENVSIGVEVYNPNAPFYAGALPAATPTIDPFGLNPAQFRVVINVGADEATALGNQVAEITLDEAIPPPNRLNGRDFVSVQLDENNSGRTDFFTTDGGRTTRAGGGPIDFGRDAGDVVVVRLQRASRDDSGTVVAWSTIDKMILGMPSEQEDDDEVNWTAIRRDTRAARQFNVYANPGDAAEPTLDMITNASVSDPEEPLELPRWNVMMPAQVGGVLAGSVGSGTLAAAPQTLGNAGYIAVVGGAIGRLSPDLPLADPSYADSLLPGVPRGPTVPLFTMNAAPLNNLAAFGNATDSRPRSFPTVGFLHFVPRFSHINDVPMSEALERQWDNMGYIDTPGAYAVGGPFFELPTYPCDFGHMPVFENDTTNLDADPAVFANGQIPWGQLVYDYFTTLDPSRPGFDPLQIPGRIDVNSASPLILSRLRMLGPNPGSGLMPYAFTGDHTDPSPEFWDPVASGLVGVYRDWVDGALRLRLDMQEAPLGSAVPGLFAGAVPTYRLGDALGFALAAYRDGVQNQAASGVGIGRLADADLWEEVTAGIGTGAPNYRAAPGIASVYGPIRRQAELGPRGFETVGELLNVKGMDGTRMRAPGTRIPLPAGAGASGPTQLTRVMIGDYVGAVSMMALLDTQNLTTRSNTFTIYASVMDRSPGNLDKSVRAQVTVDRTNLLPRLEYGYYDPATGLVSTTRTDFFQIRVPRTYVDASGTPQPIRNEPTSSEPQVIAEKRGGYFNSLYDN